MASLLVTPRLSLRLLGPQDSPFLLELMNEPPYIDNIGDRGVRTIEDATRYIEEKYVASYARHGFGLYLVELAESGVPIGICGLVRRDLLEHPDLGFAFLQRHWSKGYATEAASAALDYARDSLGLTHVLGLVSPKNSRSIRLLEHLGLRHERSVVLAGQQSESHVYGKQLTASEPATGPLGV